MRIDVEQNDWDRIIADMTGAFVTTVWSSMATEIRQIMKRIPPVYWKPDTGVSAKAWRVRRKGLGRKVEIGISNLFDYGAIINNAPSIRGRRSTHYQATQRWIRLNWNVLTQRTVVRAEAAAQRAAKRAEARRNAAAQANFEAALIGGGG